jgi:UDP-N-acetylmuramoyl-L-alanyl-D-glutamate--2,6-diaminopimelate ligase
LRTEVVVAELALQEMLQAVPAGRVEGDARVRVRGVKHDSRRVEPGDLFAALPGLHDGARYAQDAIARGAVAVLAERPLAVAVPVLVVENALLALSRVATLLYDDPTRELSVVGITGTNGKTTTAYLLEAILHAAGKKPAVIGTVNFRSPAGVLPATHTTPMADDLMRLSQWVVKSGATHLVLEVSSHGLAMHRVDGVHFRVAAFTNLTQDHLDFHGDLVNYGASKRRLFTDLSPDVSVLNIDDPAGFALVTLVSGQVLRCSKHAAAEAELRALVWSSDRKGTRARLATPQGECELTSPLSGEHNLENLLIAFGCGLALGLPNGVISHALASAQGAPGRLERIEHSGDVLVFVDYAHTPDALIRVLETVRKTTQNRLIVVFGCGGDRDAGKRPLMGRAGADRADVVVLTSDNPRSEDPASILAQVEGGVQQSDLPRLEHDALRDSPRGYCVQSDRRAAIRLALHAARVGDTVLIAGKGHEKFQIVGEKHLPFDDCVEARAGIALLAGAR